MLLAYTLRLKEINEDIKNCRRCLGDFMGAS
jgi:hypothetical protein